MAKLGVQVLGDATGLKVALGESTAATEKWAAATSGSSVKVAEAFKGVSTAALQAQVAQDKLAISYGRYGEGSLGAAAATVRYRKELEGLQATSTASLRTVGRNLTTYVSLPLAAVGYEAVKMAVTFQQEMLKIQTQAGASAAEVKNLSGQVLDLAKVTPQGPEQLAQGLFHLESVGLRGAKAMQTLRIAALAAGMGTASLEDTTSALGGAVVTGIKGTENYTQAMGLLNATIGAGNMKMQDLLDALGTGLLPKAKNAGVSLDEVGAALAVLTDRGIPAQKAATQLGTTFALMMAPSKAAEKALKAMGIGATQLRTELAQPGGLLKVLETLRDGMDRVGKGAGATDILSAFGRSRQSGAILTLVESLNSGLSSYDAKITQVNENAKQYAINQKTYMESPAYQLHSALSTLESDLTKLGQSIAPEVTTGVKDIAAAVDVLAKGFEALPHQTQEALGIVAAALALGGPLALSILGIRKLVGAMRVAFVGVGTSAVEGATVAEAEMAGVGAAATGATAEVGLLRGALLGLGGPAVLAAIAGVGAAIATNKLGGGAKGGTHTLNNGDGTVTTYTVDPGTGFVASSNTKKVSEPLVPGVAGGVGEHGALRKQHYPGPAGAAGNGAAVTGYHPSRATLLNTALAKNPDNVAAINAKLAYDREAAAFAEKRIAEGKGSASLEKELQAVYQDENSLQDHLTALHDEAAAAAKKHDTAVKKHKAAVKKAAETLTIPLDLQLAQAKADASGVESQQTRAEKRIRAWAESIVHAKKTTEQQMIDAFNLIAQENSALGGGTKHASQRVKESSMKFVSGIDGLTGAARKELEQRFAQVQAHGGYAPTGHGVLGQNITINVHGDPNPDRTADRVLKKLQQHGRHGTAQRRGPHAGAYLGLH